MSDDARRDDPGGQRPDEEAVRRPGPHGAEAQDLIARAYRRAERSTRRSFLEVTPKSVTAAEAVTSLDGEGEEGAKRARGLQSRACFIATAAYGDANAPEVERLRRFRDRQLLTNRPGTAFVRFYYRFSPPLARLIARKPRLRAAVRQTLDFFQNRAAL